MRHKWCVMERGSCCYWEMLTTISWVTEYTDLTANWENIFIPLIFCTETITKTNCQSPHLVAFGEVLF